MIKNIINGFLSIFGFKLNRLYKTNIHNAIEYNTLNITNEFYADNKAVEKYIDNHRLAFFETIINYTSNQKLLDFQCQIADVSAGTGHFLKILESKFPKNTYTGYEFSSAALDVCRKVCPSINFNSHNLYEPFPEIEKYDIMYCIDTLEHLEYPEKAILNMLNALNSNGKIILVVPNGQIDTFEGHIHFWSMESFRLMLKKLPCNIISSIKWDKEVEIGFIIEKN